MELKEKIDVSGEIVVTELPALTATEREKIEEALRALVTLGYKQYQAKASLEKVIKKHGRELSLEDTIKNLGDRGSIFNYNNRLIYITCSDENCKSCDTSRMMGVLNQLFLGIDIKKMDTSLQIIAISSKSFHPELEEAIRDYVYACLRQPVDPDELIYWIKSIQENDHSKKEVSES